MAEIDFKLTAAPALGGADLGIGGNRITERRDLALVSVAVPQGGEAGLVKALKSAFKIDFPGATQSTTAGETRAIRTSPDQLMLVFPRATPDAEPHVQAGLKGAGYTTDQTGAWVVLEISGPATLAALERLCPLDTAVMPQDAAARTVIEHMGAMIVRLGPERFLLLSAGSSAQSFLHAVETSLRYVT